MAAFSATSRFLRRSVPRNYSGASGLILTILAQIATTFIFCEYLIYYFVIMTCSWPHLSCPAVEPLQTLQAPLRALILSDPHLLGKYAHWLDKLRREWQMTRSFQTANFLHDPDVVFILGDILDNGQNANMADFQEDLRRFRRMFASSVPVICAVGNHDIGFHYRIMPELRQRFEKAFSSRPVQLVEMSGVRFVLLNSMAFEGDRCTMCQEAEVQLLNVSRTLSCQRAFWESRSGRGEVQELPTECMGMELSAATPFSKPIVMQHFPMFRPSDEECHEPDEAPPDEKSHPFRGTWECLSQEATDKIMKAVEPRAVFSGHTHHGCHRKHDNGVDEWTVSSFNWRNKINPAFLMVSICANTLAVDKCFLPNEHTVYLTYTVSGVFLVMWLMWRLVARLLKRYKVRFD